MGRKSKKKEEVVEEKVSIFEFIPIWVYAIIYIILAILAIGPLKPLGLVGKIVRVIGIFFFGKLNLIFVIGIFLLGIYILVKKEYPKIFDKKMIGIYILLIGVLINFHIGLIKSAGGTFGASFTAFFSDFSTTFNNVFKGEFTTHGGGIIGWFFAALFKILFDYTGTYIVSIILIIIGICFFTGTTIYDVLNPKELKEKLKINKKEQEIKYDEETGEVEEEDIDPDERLLIESIDELRQTIIEKNQIDARKEQEDEKIEKEFTERLEGTGIIQFTSNQVAHNYVLPDASDVLNKVPTKQKKNDEDVNQVGQTIVEVLEGFGINDAKVVDIHVGPAVTQYELEVGHRTKLNKIVGLTKEISLALAKKDVRIQAPIPGKSTIGIEAANKTVQSVSFREVFDKLPENKKESKLLVGLGKNLMGEVKYAEIDKMPHVLVAGATGSGKSVCINCIIGSILMRTKPDEVKLVLVDPKKVELGNYNGVPHLLTPVVTDPKKASIALQKIVHEMDSRYEIFEQTKVKNISTYNALIDKKNKNKPDNEKIPRMPYIVVIIDELADLMLVAAKDVEASIQRITQLARAAGIHLIVATQRPSTDVITGVVKANIPSRISFAVSSQIDSRTILDMGGAEKLLGKGDMLYLPMGENIPERIQGAWLSDEETERIINWTVKQQIATYDARFDNLDAAEEQGNAGGGPRADDSDSNDDDLYNEVRKFVIQKKKASISLIQRRFKVGFNRAANLVDLLEERGVVGPATGNSKPREVLISADEDFNDADIEE